MLILLFEHKWRAYRHGEPAVLPTHGEVQPAESQNAHRKLRQSGHQFSAVVSWHRHSRPGHHGTLRSRVINCRPTNLGGFHEWRGSYFSIKLDRLNPWSHVPNRQISISQLLSRRCYLFTVSDSGLLSVQRPRPASPAHFRHSHIPKLICGFNSSIDIYHET